VLRFLEKFTGVRETNITDWRRQTFGDLSSAFRFNDIPATPPVLPKTAEQLAKAYSEVKQLPPPVVPTQDQIPPSQEAGIRRHTSSAS
jgi:phospholipase C